MFGTIERRQKRSDFPVVLYRAKTSVRRCSIYDATSAKYVVFHDRLSGHDASFQCLQCFHIDVLQRYELKHISWQ